MPELTISSSSRLQIFYNVDLIRNALDAGAESVRVSLEANGLKKISVLDDGFGMAPHGPPRCVAATPPPCFRLSFPLV